MLQSLLKGLDFRLLLDESSLKLIDTGKSYIALTMTDVVSPMRGPGIRATEVTPTLVWVVMVLTRVPTVGLTRGATVGLIVVTRESICRLGVRMMLCA